MLIIIMKRSGRHFTGEGEDNEVDDVAVEKGRSFLGLCRLCFEFPLHTRCELFNRPGSETKTYFIVGI